MKLILLLTISLLTLVITDTVTAQRCPASKRTIKVYVQNEHKANELSYQLIPLKDKVTRNDLFSEQFLFNTFGVEAPVISIPVLQADKSIELNSNYLETFVKDLKPEKEQKDNWGNKLTGKIQKGELTFNASDLDGEFYLLRVTSNNYKPAYLLGRLLGGCDTTDSVILRWSK